MSSADTSSIVKEELPPGCQYTVPRKKRLCRMTVKPGRRYCGEHDRPEPSPSAAVDAAEIDPRIPCPLDSKHTCYASKLEKHLKVCNARCDTTPDYIHKGCNSAPATEKDVRQSLKDVPVVMLKRAVEIVETLYHEHVKNSIEEHIETDSTPVHAAVAEDYALEERRHSSLRHLRQTSSLLRMLERQGLIEDDTCYVELGAGKGHVSYYLAHTLQHVTSCSVLLVDRASHRHKQDNKLDPSQHRVRRVRADICDLVLRELSDVKAARHLVAVCKHLCGAATDFALRCVSAAGVVDKTRGVVMATCCHHRCSYGAYVATDFLQELGITKEYFNIIMGIVSWATCGTGYSRERSRESVEEKRQKTSENVLTETSAPTFSEKTVTVDSMTPTDGTIHQNQDSTLGSEPVMLKKESLKEDLELKTNLRRDTERHTSLTEVKQDLTEVKQYLTDVNQDLTDVKSQAAGVKGLGLTVERRTEIGRHAKALLDFGRTVYLRKCGFDAKLCYFVDVDVSPENVCIVAKK